jgi:hypothetical protein
MVAVVVRDNGDVLKAEDSHDVSPHCERVCAYSRIRSRLSNEKSEPASLRAAANLHEPSHLVEDVPEGAFVREVDEAEESARGVCAKT